MQTRSSQSPSNSDPEDQEYTSPADKSPWTTEDERKLLEFLMEKRATMTDAQMFRSPVFRAAAEELNKSLTQGAAKTEGSCKAKWNKMKWMYNEILALKSKSGIGFMWNDEDGMGVTPDRQAEWDSLYPRGSRFHQFGNMGWPHFTAMQDLIPSRIKGTNAHRGTQLVTDMLPPPPGGSTPSSSKHAFNTLDDAALSTNSSEKRARNTPSTSTVLFGLQTTLESFGTKVHNVMAQPLPTPQFTAVKYLVESVNLSKSSEGGTWLSQSELFEALDLFRDETLSSMFNGLAAAKDEKLLHRWVRRQLERAGTGASADAPGAA